MTGWGPKSLVKGPRLSDKGSSIAGARHSHFTPGFVGRAARGALIAGQTTVCSEVSSWTGVRAKVEVSVWRAWATEFGPRLECTDGAEWPGLLENGWNIMIFCEGGQNIPSDFGRCLRLFIRLLFTASC